MTSEVSELEYHHKMGIDEFHDGTTRGRSYPPEKHGQPCRRLYLVETLVGRVFL